MGYFRLVSVFSVTVAWATTAPDLSCTVPCKPSPYCASPALFQQGNCRLSLQARFSF